MKKRCPNCGKRIDGIYNGCPCCLKRIIKCPNRKCKARNKEGTVFCVGCGMNLLTGKPTPFWERLTKKRLVFLDVLRIAFVSMWISAPIMALGLKIKVNMGLWIMIIIFLGTGTLSSCLMERSAENFSRFLGCFFGLSMCLIVSHYINILGSFYEKIDVLSHLPYKSLAYPGTWIGGVIGALTGWIIYRLSLRYLKKKKDKDEQG